MVNISYFYAFYYFNFYNWRPNEAYLKSKANCSAIFYTFFIKLPNERKIQHTHDSNVMKI